MAWIVFMLLFCSSLLVACHSSSTGDPTQQFFKDADTRPFLIYQCYHSGYSIDNQGSVNFTILFDGTSPQTKLLEGVTWSATNGTPNSYVIGSVLGHYDTGRSVGVLRTYSTKVDFVVLEPFEGKTLYVEIVSGPRTPDNTTVKKIYDVNFRCKNAKELLSKVCPDPCDMVLTREVSSD